MKRGVFLLLVLAVFTLGCDKILPPKPVITPVKKEEIKINGPLLARVNDWAIGLDDFRTYLDNLKPLAERNNIDLNSPDFKNRLLNDLVETEILAQVAVEQGVDKNEDFVRALRDTRSSLLAAKVRTDLEKDVNISSAEVQNFYEKNKQLLKRPQEMKIREIVLNNEAQAKEIYIRLLQGENFAALAKQYSQGDTAVNGGDLGFLSYDPETKFRKFWEVAVALEKGDISSIFKDDEGKYYIITVEDVTGGQEIPLAEVEDELKEGLKREKIVNETNSLIENFKSKSNVVINADLIK